MALDDFSSDSSSSSSSSKSDNDSKKDSSNKSETTDKVGQSGEEIKEAYDFAVVDHRDPAWEVDGIEKLDNVFVGIDHNKHESGVDRNADSHERLNEDGEVEEVESGHLKVIDATDEDGDHGDVTAKEADEYVNEDMSGSNTVKITKEEFENVLDETPLDFEEIDYPWASECIYEAESSNGKFSVRVYSTIEQRSMDSRNTGEDSIKTQVVHNGSGRPLFSTSRTYRVPTWPKNLKSKIQELINSRDKLRTCKECGSVMVIRENKSTGDKFFGCTMYPDCRNTRSME